MSHIPVYNLRIICSDGVIDHTHVIWSDNSTAETCPHAVAGHTVSSVEVLEIITPNTSIILDDFAGTSGIYRTKGLTFDVPAGPSSEQVIIGEYSYPYPIRMSTFTIMPSEDNIGDIFSFLSARNTVVGILTQEVSSGKSLVVNSTVIQNVKPGYVISLISGGTEQDLGECYTVNESTNTITVEKDVIETFPIGTYVRITLKRVEDIRITSTNSVVFGNGTLSSSLVPANLVGTITYQNNSDSPKKFSFFCECSY